MNVIGVIPARYSSSRFEGKVLADILGKPMLQHVWERAKQAKILDELIIACDDERVYDASRGFGANVVLTAKGHACGTDRIIEVVNPREVKVVVNIQGDEPLIDPMMIDMAARSLLEDETVSMATIMKKIENTAEIHDPHVVKVIVDKNNFALYFSRAAIPHHAQNSEVKTLAYYKHIGLYAYTKDFLFIYRNLPVSSLEKIECLEQLRVLQEGYKIKVLETKSETIGVDTPADLERVKEFLQREKA
ncbi:MAG TPA: 3-deoxy-manno-octulosonate cytidylyltransferase [Patescibacteria group bacterium]|nr:3-deoxy-manno-octulosonate cytidylyltransferase [Patescibacteria group bacterium]